MQGFEKLTVAVGTLKEVVEVELAFFVTLYAYVRGWTDVVFFFLLFCNNGVALAAVRSLLSSKRVGFFGESNGVKDAMFVDRVGHRIPSAGSLCAL